MITLDYLAFDCLNLFLCRFILEVHTRQRYHRIKFSAIHNPYHQILEGNLLSAGSVSKELVPSGGITKPHPCKHEIKVLHHSPRLPHVVYHQKLLCLCSREVSGMCLHIFDNGRRRSAIY